MSKLSSLAALSGSIALAAAGLASPAQAQGLFSGMFDGVNMSFGGFLRAESAIRTTAEENLNNQGGNPFNNREIERQAFAPPALNPTGAAWAPPPWCSSTTRSPATSTSPRSRTTSTS
jgi:hypothetical protein